jgi:hypothetical protein
MNSFSPTKTVSNSKTAVRFAVDFIFRGLTAIPSLAALTLGFALIGNPSLANTSQRTEIDSLSDLCMKTDDMSKALCKELREERRARGGGNRQSKYCDDLEKQIGDTWQKATKACIAANLGGSNLNKCFDQVQWCQNAEEEIQNLVADEEMSEDQVCDTVLANSCPGLPRFMEGRNFREEEKDAERERLQAKRDVDELTKERRDAQRDMLKQQRELQEAQQDAAYEVRKAEREIAKDMSAQFKEVQEGQKKAFEDAQRAYQEMDAAYIKMRHESRQLAVKVEEAKDKFHGQCIAQAESQFKAAEQARQAAKNKKKKNAGSATRLAGSTKRNNLNQTRLRNFDYNAYLNECLNGQTGVGKSLANSVRSAEREKAANDQYLQEQASLIEQQRQTMLKKLMELEGTAESQNAEVVKVTNERLQNLSEEQQRIATKNQARLSEFMQDQQLRLNDIDQRLQTETQQLTRYQQEAMVANRRATCAGSAARKSESSLEKIGQGFAEAVGEITGLSSTCVQFKKSCNPDTRSASGGVEGVRVAASEPTAPADAQTEVSRYVYPQACVLATQAVSDSGTRLKKRGNWSPDSGRGTSR